MPNRTPRKAILTRRLVVLGSLVLCGGAGLASLLLWLNRLAEPWAWVLGLTMGATLAPVVEPEPDVDWVAVDGAVLAGERRSQASEVASSDTEPSVSKTEVPSAWERSARLSARFFCTALMLSG